MTSDLWYVGKVLANEPKREDGGVGQKRVERKSNLYGKLQRCIYVSSISLFTSKTLKK